MSCFWAGACHVSEQVRVTYKRYNFLNNKYTCIQCREERQNYAYKKPILSFSLFCFKFVTQTLPWCPAHGINTSNDLLWVYVTDHYHIFMRLKDTCLKYITTYRLHLEVGDLYEHCCKNCSCSTDIAAHHIVFARNKYLCLTQVCWPVFSSTWTSW
jgi:hypothetical protein